MKVLIFSPKTRPVSIETASKAAVMSVPFGALNEPSLFTNRENTDEWRKIDADS